MRCKTLVACAAFTNAASVSPVQKVIQLLNDMTTKCKKEKSEEEVEFAKFSQFCKGEIPSKKNSIAKSNELIERLSAEIQKLESDINGLVDDLEELNTGVAKADSDIKDATKQREQDHASATEQINDYAESCDALDRAILMLSKQSHDHKQASAALLQFTSDSKVPSNVQRTLAAFVDMNSGADFLTQDAPEANAYEFQSGGILDLLKKLREDFTSKRSEAEKGEMNSKAASELMCQDLYDQIENMKSDISDKTEDKEMKKVQKAEDNKRLSETTVDRDEDVATLKDLETECFEKKQSFDEKQNLRAQEIMAISKAIEIMSSSDVSGSAEKHLPGMLQTSFAQLRSSGHGASPIDAHRVDTVRFLKREASRLRSSQLSMLADKFASDPFAKVKKLIDEMITRLIEEAGSESEQKGFCDKELGTNKKTRTKLQDSIDGLTAQIDETEATITELAGSLTTLAQEINELQTSMTESTTMRNMEKDKNVITIEDAKGAQEACKAAMGVLKDFYAKSAQATAFVQERGPFDMTSSPKMGTAEWDALGNPNAEPVDKGHTEEMQTFGDTYQGDSAGAGGVLAMMEVIMSDFSTLEAETAAAEAEASRSYADFMTQSKKSVAVKEKGTDMLSSDKTAAESQLVTDKKDLAATQDQLLAADRYYEKLKPSCVNTGISYGERTKARQEEIQSLKEALQILSGESI